MQLNAHRYPTWASLARNYLAIMVSSVSSEHTFSAAGITTRKHRNWLKGDIVEALECIKCLLHRNIIFREVIHHLHHSSRPSNLSTARASHMKGESAPSDPLGITYLQPTAWYTVPPYTTCMLCESTTSATHPRTCNLNTLYSAHMRGE
jgi:hypothetical protein